jgi:hypothetical protein
MWRNVHGHAIYQMIVLIVVIFGLQGVLVQNYDVKCLLTRENDGPCPTNGLNPWYAGDLYFQLDTLKYWQDVGTKDELKKKEAYDSNEWTKF